MSDHVAPTKRNPLSVILLALFGGLAVIVGWAIFAQYRVHHAGLAL